MAIPRYFAELQTILDCLKCFLCVSLTHHLKICNITSNFEVHFTFSGFSSSTVTSRFKDFCVDFYVRHLSLYQNTPVRHEAWEKLWSVSINAPLTMHTQTKSWCQHNRLIKCVVCVCVCVCVCVYLHHVRSRLLGDELKGSTWVDGSH